VVAEFRPLALYHLVVETVVRCDMNRGCRDMVQRPDGTQFFDAARKAEEKLTDVNLEVGARMAACSWKV
jgi:hypothetical protein